GSQFTSPSYISLLQAAGVRISMDGKGRATDNIFTERLWRSLKYEEVYIHEYTSPRQAREGIRRYLDFYNTGRPHQALGYETPAEAHFGRELEIHSIHSFRTQTKRGGDKCNLAGIKNVS
ncbi:MAG TPA: integrase core domain-containing protein, partial [Bacillota bacterium]